MLWCSSSGTRTASPPATHRAGSGSRWSPGTTPTRSVPSSTGSFRWVSVEASRRSGTTRTWIDRVEKLIAEMRSGQQPSLGWLVAMKVDFERRWSLLGREARSLLHAKYVVGYTSKEIAEQRGLTPGTVDNKLSAAKATARLVLEDLTEQR